ncbi:MAG: hypothetical protein JJU45_20015 [Acidimicrobiia bacterium]|nr:hypothetical protein [Acidimicrobiia bacterium]MCC5954381.1 hypothetical protein [Acidimicrobiia bacterium]
MRANTALRWVHLGFGLVLSYYFLFKPPDGWSDSFENFVSGMVMTVVAWTGIIKWQLPHLRRWWRKRRADPQQVGAADG